MSYNSVVEMSNSQSLRVRMVAAAAGENISNPEQWTSMNLWRLVSSVGWGDKWDDAKGSYQINLNPDYGVRNDVIADSDILAAIQAVSAEQP